MRIILSSAGSRGDVYPLIYLGEILQRRGHEIIFVTTPDYAKECKKKGFQVENVGTDFRELMDSFKEHMGKPLKVMTEGLEILGNELGHYFKGVMKVGEEADIIITSGIQFTAQAASEVLGIPYRYVVHMPILLPSGYHGPYFMPFQNLPKFLNRFLWSIDNLISKYTVGIKVNKIRLSAGLAPRKGIRDHVDQERMVIAVSPELGPIAPDNSDIGLQLDYFFNPEEGELSEKMVEFLSKGDAPVYFGFGSMTDGKADRTLSVIFETVKILGIRAVISRGWAKYSHEDLPEEIIFADEEPHGKLFPKMRAIVHHGGAGTTSNAARAGVPQITLPHVLDQYYWSNRIKKLGIGPGGIKKSKFTSKNLAIKLLETIENKEMVLKAKELGEKLKARNGLELFADTIEKELQVN